MNKQIKLLAVLALFLFSLIPMQAVTAADAEISLKDILIYRVDIDDSEESALGSGEKTIGPVFAGDRVQVKVFWFAPVSRNESGETVTLTGELEARVNVELDDEELESDFFTIKPGWKDASSFVFKLPTDIDEGRYRLHIELEDEFGVKQTPQRSFFLDVTNKRHTVEIFDVNFPQGLTVKAGQTFLASVGVRNLGDVKEEDIRVSVSVPQLGLFQRSNSFDLFTEECIEENRPECNDDDDEWKDHKDLFLTVPSNTVSGTYELLVKVEYDDGDKEEEQVYSLVVTEGLAPTDALISIDKTTQTFAQGSGAVYTIMFSKPGDYSVRVEGVSDWGTSSVNVENDQAFVFVSAKEDIASGSYPFKVKVLSGANVVKEFDLTANVTAFQGPTADIKEGLQIGFAVLLVILIILGIILAAKKIGRSEKYDESLMDEGETYY